MIFKTTEAAVEALVAYGIAKDLIAQEDRYYTENLLMDVMKLEPSAEFGQGSLPKEEELPALEDILGY